MNEMGERIRTTREERGMTKKALAERLYQSVASVSAYESGVQIPPTDVLRQIADALGVTAAYLLGSEKGKTFPTDGLTDQQRSFMELLFAEFCSPTTAEPSRRLSVQQEELLFRLLEIFSQRG